LKKPAVGLFHNSSRGKRSAWNENQQPDLTKADRKIGGKANEKIIIVDNGSSHDPSWLWY
jgi:hypothetical protein